MTRWTFLSWMGRRMLMMKTLVVMGRHFIPTTPAISKRRSTCPPQASIKTPSMKMAAGVCMQRKFQCRGDLQ